MPTHPITCIAIFLLVSAVHHVWAQIPEQDLRHVLIRLPNLAALMTIALLALLLRRSDRKLKISREALSKAIHEKNILLYEMHHRVKNNLQVISSLLKLQSGYIHDDAVMQAMAESRNRIQSIALLHQNVYQEDNLTGVHMQAYLDELIQGLFDTFILSPGRIQLHAKIIPITLDIDTVVPLGLITNELISNSLKHAFPENTSGNLLVELSEQNANLILRIHDDGIAHPDATTQHGFGGKLIQALCQKLEADLVIHTQRGTEAIVTIRAYRKMAA